MKFAIVKLGGKQFKVSEGSTIKLEIQPEVSFDVLLYSNLGETLVGDPVVKDIVVKAHLVEETFEKTTIARFRAKSRYRKVKGHKQPISVIMIDSISKAGEKTVEAEKPAAKSKATTAANKTDKKVSAKEAKPAAKAKTASKAITKKGSSKKDK